MSQQREQEERPLRHFACRAAMDPANADHWHSPHEVRLPTGERALCLGMPYVRDGQLSFDNLLLDDEQVQDLDTPQGPENMTPEQRAAVVELETWWIDQAHYEAEQVVPKAIEYGANSLAQVGKFYARGQGREVTVGEALELGCLVYAYGKMERWIDAALRGERPSDDTLHDIGVYTRMAQRIRETGDWPGTRPDKDPETNS